MNNEEWLKDLKVGDVVVSGDTLSTVTKITKNQIQASLGLRYRRDTGQRIPRDIWHPSYIEPVTDEWRFNKAKRDKRQLLRTKLRNLDESKLSMLVVEAMLALLKTHEEREKGAQP